MAPRSRSEWMPPLPALRQLCSGIRGGLHFLIPDRQTAAAQRLLPRASDDAVFRFPVLRKVQIVYGAEGHSIGVVDLLHVK